MSEQHTETNFKSKINAPIELIWPTIRSFDGIERYLPMVMNSHLEVKNDVTNRVCNVQLDPNTVAKLVERLDFVDDANHSIGYTITEAPNPFQDAVGVIKLTALSKNQCEIEFSGSFKVQSNPEVKKMAEEIYSMIVDGLKKLHE